MEWKEVKIYTTTEGIEPVSAMLLETGVTGIQVEDDRELKEYLNTRLCRRRTFKQAYWRN